MNDFLNIVLGITLGSLGMYALYAFFTRKRNRQVTEKQSIILLEKIKNVCKLVTVEGEFAEIYHYENKKERFWRLISSSKKALLVINARAHIGFDLKKIGLRADNDRKRIVITSFPEPEVLSIEPDVQYYDLKDGFFNKFNHSDHSALQKEAREHILGKIPQSGLMDAAKKEALDAVLMIESMVQAIGWTLDYGAIKLAAGKTARKISLNQESNSEEESLK